ncbi:hypothetical protein JDV02_005720 [Purpureocillium takamizusanense]|uniref:Uncharacterized protein n=1 Tax=Purpureocillium takamizusanense TaxID=2060973 RepID=A0A9Q8QH36_9HYPO|nr:uncharacterized protein JDV02_005720 [Purpureocillium takamizusanense]UNI19540.1 hypothetical protein JDV02_005720 [Purpureocillium takamizusanense]
MKHLGLALPSTLLLLLFSGGSHAKGRHWMSALDGPQDLKTAQVSVQEWNGNITGECSETTQRCEFSNFAVIDPRYNYNNGQPVKFSHIKRGLPCAKDKPVSNGAALEDGQQTPAHYDWK